MKIVLQTSFVHLQVTAMKGLYIPPLSSSSSYFYFFFKKKLSRWVLTRSMTNLWISSPSLYLCVFYYLEREKIPGAGLIFTPLFELRSFLLNQTLEKHRDTHVQTGMSFLNCQLVNWGRAEAGRQDPPRCGDNEPPHSNSQRKNKQTHTHTTYDFIF